MNGKYILEGHNAVAKKYGSRTAVPEWLVWEQVYAGFDLRLQKLIDDTEMYYVDHTDTCIVLGFNWDYMEILRDFSAGNLDAKDDWFQGLWNLGFETLQWATNLEWAKDPRFYDGRKWRILRYACMLQQGNWCRVCGRFPPDVQLHVDHIQPRSKAPELALELSNLQVLCRDCNLGKGNGDNRDWRVKPAVASCWANVDRFLKVGGTTAT